MTRDRSQRLGRGLAALLGEPNITIASAEVHDVAVDLLDPNPHQPRGSIDPASLDELTVSIRSQGILQPILVRRHQASENRFQIIAGERRWRAAKAAGFTDVPCLIQDMDDHQSAVAALVENLQRLDLNALEEARGFEHLLIQFRITQEALADVVGKSRSHVANTLRLLKLPEPIQDMVRSGALSAGHARTLLSHPSPLEAAGQIVRRQLSVRQAEAMVERANAHGSDTDKAHDIPEAHDDDNRDPDIVAVERDLADQLGMGVKLRAAGGRGSLTVRFSRLEQLDFLIARLGQSRRLG